MQLGRLAAEAALSRKGWRLSQTRCLRVIEKLIMPRPKQEADSDAQRTIVIL